jgi:hypothetical protein
LCWREARYSATDGWCAVLCCAVLCCVVAQEGDKVQCD